MRKTFLVFSLLFLFSVSYAQTILDFNLGEFLPVLTTNLKEFGLVPDLRAGCEDPDNCNIFELESTKAFFIVLVLFWMILNIVLGLGDMPSMLSGFFVTSLIFKYLPAIFDTDIMGLFKFVFSGLFIFIWLEYIMRYLFAFSKTTKLFLQASITLIAIFFLNSINVFDLISGWLTIVVSEVGFVIFIVFMLGMRIISAYSGLLSVGAAKKLRNAGKTISDTAYADAEKEMKSKKGV